MSLPLNLLLFSHVLDEKNHHPYVVHGDERPYDPRFLLREL